MYGDEILFLRVGESCFYPGNLGGFWFPSTVHGKHCFFNLSKLKYAKFHAPKIQTHLNKREHLIEKQMHAVQIYRVNAHF